MKQITPEQFDSEVLRSETPVVVDFYTEHCSPCRFVSPLIEEVELESRGAFKAVKIDAASDPVFTAKYGVRAVPTLFIFRKGRSISQAVGAKSKKDLQRWIQDAIEKEG